MKTRTRSLAGAIVATVFLCASAATLAMPKAAEDESAQVSSGANAARPQHSSAKPPASKAKPAKKSVKPAKANPAAKKPKATQRRK